MFNRLLITLLCFFSLACTQNKDLIKKGRTIELKDFFKNSLVSRFRISPDGKKIAALRPYKDRLNIFVKPVQSTEWERITSVEDRDISGFYWKGSEGVLYRKDFGGDENYHIFYSDLETLKSTDLTPFKNTQARVLSLLSNASKTDVLIQMNNRDKRYFDVYRLNINTGKLRLIEKNPGNITEWVTDHKGNIRYSISTDGVSQTLSYRSKDGEKFKKLKTFNFKEAFTPVFFDENDENVYVLSNINRNTSAAVLVDAATLKEVKTIYENERYDLNHLNYSRKTLKLIEVGYVDWKSRRKVFDKKYQTIYSDLENKIKNKEIIITSSDEDEKLFTIYAGSDRSRGKYYTYDYESKELLFLADPSPWIDESEMASMKPITFMSRDGLKIEGYLTLPVGKSEKNLPIIVNPHGGPWIRDSWRYNSEVQFLANRGYGVLQINFRGSTGYGRKFWEASFKQWGRAMQNDITDGVQWLIDKEVADPNKICIYGGSYGGYAALAGLTYTPDLYRCGVDYVGVSNLLSFMRTIPPYWKPYLKMLYEQIGNPNNPAEKKMLMDYSPFYNADKIKAPLFVAQGAKDPRVNKDESDQIVSALRKRGVKVQYMVKDNEGHGFRNQENRFEFYMAMEKFFAKYL